MKILVNTIVIDGKIITLHQGGLIFVPQDTTWWQSMKQFLCNAMLQTGNILHKMAINKKRRRKFD